MTVLGLNHINLQAPRALLDELCRFYQDVVGLRLGERPPFARFGYWLYAGDHDVLHLAESRAGEPRQTHVRTTFDHLAFACADLGSAQRKLAEQGVAYEIDHVEQTGAVQLFFRDPAGNGVELNFAPPPLRPT
jgi:catechol 2,3-dioxygenase-like lactoylglutathione lyase family enzyme